MKLEFESNEVSSPLVSNVVPTEFEEAEKSPEVLEMLREGIKAAQDGNRAVARNLLMKVTEADSRNENAWLWLASISEYPEELLVFLNNVLQINPENERALQWSAATKSLISKTFVQRGIEAAKEEKKEFAKQCFLQAIVHDPKSELAWLWLASVSEDLDEKVAHLQKVLSINPDNENALSSLKNAREHEAKLLLPKANTAAISGRTGEAKALLEKIFDSAPDFEDAWMLRAHISDSFDEKIEAFEKVLEINPENPVARTNIDSLRMFASNQETETADEIPSPEHSSHEAHSLGEYDSAEGENETEGTFEEHVASELAENDVPEYEEAGVKFEYHEEQAVPYQDVVNEGNSNSSDAAGTETTEYQQEADDTGPESDLNYAHADSGAENEALEYVSSDESGDEDSESAYFEDASYSDNPNDEHFPASEDAMDSEDDINAGDADSDQDHVRVDEYAGHHAEESMGMEFTETAESAEEHNHFEAAEEMTDMDNTSEDQDGKGLEMESAEPEAFDEGDHADFEEQEQDHHSEYSEAATPYSFEPEMPSFESSADLAPEFPHQNAETQRPCPFCHESNENQAFACHGCKAIFTISDIEMILSHSKADHDVISGALQKMESEKALRGVELEELKFMGIGYLNLKDYRKGLEYLREAVKREPNDVVLGSQIDALAVRIGEIEQQERDHEMMPEGKRILVVDDSPTVRKLISGKLEKCGHEAICAVDGMDALAKINEMIPDLILLDITMPRMDGYQVCKLIRGNDATKDIPVVMISGKDGFFDKVRGRMAGTSHYITKPFGPETLMKTVKDYIK